MDNCCGDCVRCRELTPEARAGLAKQFKNLELRYHRIERMRQRLRFRSKWGE